MSYISLDNRVAVITGAGGGLGRAHALELARRGARIVVNDLGGTVDGSVNGTDHSQTAAEKVVAEIRAEGGVAVANFDTVATPEGGAAIVATALETYGRVDIVINNAGILRDRAFHNMDADSIHAVVDTHLKGALFVTRPAFEVMRDRGYGRIVNTTSASGLYGNFGQANYGAAKAGLAGLTRVLALEGVRHNIRVNAIAPLAHTRMTEGLLGSLGDKLGPETVTPVVAYLASEECEVTGQIFSVSGGRVARIFIAETQGYLLPELSAEAVRDGLGLIGSVGGYLTPGSLDEVRAIIDNALLQPKAS